MPKGDVSIKELAWWLLCQVEMEHNLKKFVGLGKSMPNRTIKWKLQEIENRKAVAYV